MPRSRTGAPDFGAAFTTLLQAAGLTPDKVRAALGDQRWIVSRSTLYDWMRNEHLPDGDGPLMEVVGLCLAAARKRGARVAPAPQDAQGWTRLLAEAKQARDTSAVVAYRPAKGRSAASRPGTPIGRWHPLALGVHRAIGGQLPGYVERAHDDLLRTVLDPSIEDSRAVVLRGSSSTGKTRAAYEAVRDCLPDWLVDYPKTGAILGRRLLDGFAPRTVVWLDDLLQFINPDAEVLAELNDSLAGSTRVIVIATMWPVQWEAIPHVGPGTLGKGNFYPGLKPLLQGLPELSNLRDQINPAYGGIIDVPDRFTDSDLARAIRQRDHAVVSAINTGRLAGAAGMVAQYLAGVPDLENHYTGPGADPYGQAVITAAIDMARFGLAGPYQEALLHQAVLGYLQDTLRVLDQDRWWPQALEYATRLLKGAVSALIPIPPSEGTGIAGFRLTDYLDQQGRRTRQVSLGPASLWEALAEHTNQSADLTRLGQSAYDRGFYRYAAVLWKKAVRGGGVDALRSLLGLLGRIDPQSKHKVAEWAAQNAPLDDPATIAKLLHFLRGAKFRGAANVLVTRAAAGVSIGDPDGLALFIEELQLMTRTRAIRATADRLAKLASGEHALSSKLLDKLNEAGELDAIIPLATDYARHADLCDPQSVISALRMIKACGRQGQSIKKFLLDRDPASSVTLDDSEAVKRILQLLHEVRADQALAVLANRAAEKVSIKQPLTVVLLLQALNETGQHQAIDGLMARDPARHVVLDSTGDIASLFEELQRNGRPDVAAALAYRFAAKAPLDNPRKLDRLFRALIDAGEREPARMLARRAVERRVLRRYASNLLYMWDAVFVFVELYRAGEDEAAAALASQVIEEEGPWHPWRHSGVDDLLAVARRLSFESGADVAQRLTSSLVTHDYVQGSLDNPRQVAARIKWLDRAASKEALAALLSRRPADHVTLRDPGGVALLLGALRRLGESGAVTDLLARHPEEQVTVGDARGAANLLREMLAGGAREAVDSFIRRIVDEVRITDSEGAAILLNFLSGAGAADAVLRIGKRSALHADVGDPKGTAQLLDILVRIDLRGEVTEVAMRTAGQAKLDNIYDVIELLDALRRAEVTPAFDVLVNRAANAGHFILLSERGFIEGYTFGREPDGTASSFWSWGGL